MPPETYKSVTELKDLPEGSHYAIIESDTVYTPGDERSRTNPGHGYPESWDSIIRYTAYYKLEHLKSEIERRERTTYSKKAYRVVQVTPLTVTTSIDVKIKAE